MIPFPERPTPPDPHILAPRSRTTPATDGRTVPRGTAGRAVGQVPAASAKGVQLDIVSQFRPGDALPQQFVVQSDDGSRFFEFFGESWPDATVGHRLRVCVISGASTAWAHHPELGETVLRVAPGRANYPYDGTTAGAERVYPTSVPIKVLVEQWQRGELEWPIPLYEANQEPGSFWFNMPEDMSAFWRRLIRHPEAYFQLFG